MPPIIPTAGRARTITIGFPTPLFRPYYKVEITDKNGTTTTYQAGTSDRVITWTITGRINAIKQAIIVLTNNDGFWTNKFTGGETIAIYADYTNVLGSTSKVFDGRLDEYRFSLDMSGQIIIELSCRQKPELEDKSITASFTDADAGTAISTLITNNFSGIVDASTVGTLGVAITTDIDQQSGVSAITTICELAGLQWYVDEAGLLQVFVKGARINQTEKATLGTNVVAASGLGLDYKDVKNRVSVYGKSNENNSDVFFLATRQDTNSQNTLWIKDDVINDYNVDTNTEAISLANAGISTTPPRRGLIQCAGGLLTLQPGQVMNIQLPLMELQGQFPIGEYTHGWSSEGLNTSFSISEDRENLARLFQERIKKDEELRDIRNENSMRQSIVYRFIDNTDTSSTANTEVTEGTLRIISGFSTGNWTSITKQLSETVTSVELRVAGDDIDSCTYAVSLDGGVTFTALAPKTLTTGLSGQQLVVRVTLTSDTNNPLPILNAVSVMAK